jgi:hypothetical protein
MSEKSETGRLKGFAKKILGDGDEDGRAKDVVSSLFEMGDKARMETVRLLAKEVRGYVEAMELDKGLNDLVTNYSLDITASFRLRPIKKEAEETEESAEIEETEES